MNKIEEIKSKITKTPNLSVAEQIAINNALEIAEAAVKHHNFLAGVGRGENNIMDAEYTAATIYSKAEVFEHAIKQIKD